MVGGGQIGPNPETRGWIAPHQQGGDPFGQGGAYGHKRGPFQQGFGDPSKLATNANLDINYRDHYPPMEQRDPQGVGDGAVVDQQRGVFKQQEWGQEGRVRGESEYQVADGRDLSVSEGSQSDGSEDEEDEDEDDEDDDDDDDDMVENDDDDDDGKEEPEGITDSQVVEGVSGVPLLHSGLDHAQLRPEHAFQRNMTDRDRATLKAAAAIGTAGTSNSPFGMFQSPSSTLPFLNSFSSPSNSTPHTDGIASQNGGGMAVIASASGVAASYSLTRDGGLSRDVVTRESTGFRETTVVTTTTTTTSLHEPSSRMSSGPLHEQLHTTDVDNYYTTLLNTQAPPNNGLSKVADAASRRMADPQSTAESSLRRILSDPLTGALMDDAMIISCGHSVGNAGRRRVMETSVCIICGASVRTEAMAPNYALRMVVQAFKREEEMNGNLSLRSAKRRRDTIQENIGLPELVAADVSKVKGVQFPFVVSDRVMIKGNKRTPERFVGREAVITTQCLNGWYLVRILDTGESVRLQYRSLQKMGGQTPSNDSEYQPN